MYQGIFPNTLPRDQGVCWYFSCVELQLHMVRYSKPDTLSMASCTVSAHTKAPLNPSVFFTLSSRRTREGRVDGFEKEAQEQEAARQPRHSTFWLAMQPTIRSTAIQFPPRCTHCVDSTQEFPTHKLSRQLFKPVKRTGGSDGLIEFRL